MPGHWQVANELTPYWLEGKYERILEVAKDYDSFEDAPWFYPHFYELLDKRFPRSKFILTVKNEHDWLRSLREMLDDWTEEERRKYVACFLFHDAVFGTSKSVGNEEHFRTVYNRHNRSVREYFKRRPDDLLIVDWEQGDGWKELCAFLQKPVPALEFPHVKSREERLEDVHAKGGGQESSIARS